MRRRAGVRPGAAVACSTAGVVFAHAHVRGGGERGRRWWLDGHGWPASRTRSPTSSPSADALADGLVDGDRIVARGLSAGGLLHGRRVLAGAATAGRGVVAEVPFVDVVTTMLDETVPLTVSEWDEWGDPRRPDDFAWMLAYSPVRQLARGGRPRPACW